MHLYSWIGLITVFRNKFLEVRISDYFDFCSNLAREFVLAAKVYFYYSIGQYKFWILPHLSTFRFQFVISSHFWSFEQENVRTASFCVDFLLLFFVLSSNIHSRFLPSELVPLFLSSSCFYLSTRTQNVDCLPLISKFPLKPAYEGASSTPMENHLSIKTSCKTKLASALPRKYYLLDFAGSSFIANFFFLARCPTTGSQPAVLLTNRPASASKYPSTPNLATAERAGRRHNSGAESENTKETVQ